VFLNQWRISGINHVAIAGLSSLYLPLKYSSLTLPEYHLKRIIINPKVRSGKPCIKNTRITVYDILKYLAGGMSESEILSYFLSLTHEDIKDVFAFSPLQELITVDPKVMDVEG